MVDNDDDNRRRKRQRSEPLTVENFLYEARKVWLRKDPFKAQAEATEDRNFREFFGCPVEVCLTLWNLLVDNDLLPSEDAKPQHLLWTLMFMKIYAKTKALCTLCGGIDKNTLYKWVFAFIDAIPYLESTVVSYLSQPSLSFYLLLMPLTMIPFSQIQWQNRFRGDRNADCLVSVDGVDCRVPNHGPSFSSHKFAKKGGVRYEVALCIQTGDIVWINGPYNCGQWTDIKIFREALIHELEEAERVEADDGDIEEAPLHVKCPKCITNPEECESMQQRVRNRQETVNNRFKFWEVLKQIFRHELTLHGDVFRCIAIISQLVIDNGQPLFQCGYKDPPFDSDSSDNDTSTDSSN
jgi:hypothetical protein